MTTPVQRKRTCCDILCCRNRKKASPTTVTVQVVAQNHLNSNTAHSRFVSTEVISVTKALKEKQSSSNVSQSIIYIPRNEP